MTSVEYRQNTFEDQMIHFLVDRSAIEKDAISKLTQVEREVIRMKYYECMSSEEIRKALGISTSWVTVAETKALHKLKDIILRQRTTVVDSKIGMKENEWEYLASSIARWLERQSTNPALLGKRHGVLSQWAKDIIMWRLTSDERETLLCYHKIGSHSKKNNYEYFIATNLVHQKILNLFLEDDLVIEKTNYKQRV